MAKKHFLVTFHIQKDKRMTLGTAVHTSPRCGALVERFHNISTHIPGGPYYNERRYKRVYEVDGPLLGHMIAADMLCKRCP